MTNNFGPRGTRPEVTAGLHIEWVRDETGFASLRAAWNTIADTMRSHPVFFRHEWFDAAWQWRKIDSTLALLCVYRNGQLVGIAPLLRTRRRRRGLPVRSLEFLAVPDTQFCDVLALPGQRAAVAAAVADALLAASRAWDVLDLARLAPDAAAREDLGSRLSARGLPCRLQQSEMNLYIDLTAGWQDFYGQRSRRLKKTNNSVANRLQRAVKQADIEHATAVGPINCLASASEAAISLSSRSWKKRTGVSLDQPGPRLFFRRLVDHTHHTNWLSIWLLRLDQVPTAMELQIAYGGQIYALRSDFAEAQKSLAPGSYLNHKMLESLFAQKSKRYWLGPGENSYKLHWTSTGEPLYTLTAYNRTARGRWLACYEMTIRPQIKTLLRRTPDVAPPPDSESA